jgi:hypothetical protein
MSFAFTQDVPIDAAFYGRITAGLGDATPDGLVVHLAVERAEGGLRYLDVWESRSTGTGSSTNGCIPSCTASSARCSATTFLPSRSRFPSP